MRLMMQTKPWLALALLLGVAGAHAQPAGAASVDKAMQAKSIAEAMSALGVVNPEAGKRVLLEAPDVAVRGKPLPVKVSSQMPGTDWIAILSERSPTPLVQVQEYSPGADRSLALDVKMEQTGRLRAIVRAGGKYYQVAREVKLADQGCRQK